MTAAAARCRGVARASPPLASTAVSRTPPPSPARRRSPLGLAVLVGVARQRRRARRRPRTASDDVDARRRASRRCSSRRPTTVPAENYLLVGSDSREGIDPDDPNAGAIGDADDVVGRRSDTIMILRRERNGGALAAQPAARPVGRDRRHRRVGQDQRGLQRGPERLAATVTQSLGIPIHHYVEVDFVGFTGHRRRDRRRRGVRRRTRPTTPTPGSTSSPAARRSTARRRWPTPAAATTRSGSTATGRGPAGRPRPHRAPAAVHPHGRRRRCCSEIESDPFSLGDLIGAATASVRDRRRASTRSRPPTPCARPPSRACSTYTLPVEGVETGRPAVLELADEAEPILDYFRGVGAGTARPTTTG